MNYAQNVNEISTLSSVLLSTLDEAIFFGKISGFFHEAFKEHSVQAYKVYSDGAIQLVSENGKAHNDGEIIERPANISGYVIRTKRAYISNNVQRDPLFHGQSLDASIHSELCVPVVSQGTIIATINVRSANEERKFSEKDINLVLEILEELKAPIHNMKLYLMAKHLNRELMKKIETVNKELLSKGEVKKSDIKIIGHNSEFLGVLDIISKVAREDFPVLLEGECGAGKKIIARKLHSLSSRNAAESVVLNCQLSEEDFEQELVGREERIGLLERANGGTLILSNISELSDRAQRKILAVLTTGKITLNTGKELALNIRVVATSRVNLKEKVENGEFNADLYQRVSTIKVIIPALRNRADDIKLLATYFLNDNREESEKKNLTSKAIEILNAHNWSGNVRELKSVMERVFIMTDGKYVDAEDIPALGSAQASAVVEEESFEEISLHDLEKQHIVRTLGHLDGNKTKAAKSLGITVKTLYNKLHSYGLISSRA